MGTEIPITADVISRIRNAVGEEFEGDSNVEKLVDELLRERQLKQQQEECVEVSKAKDERYRLTHGPTQWVKDNAEKYFGKPDEAEAEYAPGKDPTVPAFGREFWSA